LTSDLLTGKSSVAVPQPPAALSTTSCEMTADATSISLSIHQLATKTVSLALTGPEMSQAS
jgi:hypothetical protein